MGGGGGDTRKDGGRERKVLVLDSPTSSSLLPLTYPRSHSNLAKDAKQLWEYLVHQEEVRETFIHYIFNTKV